ncbi:DUF6678 family protein [Aquirhabdus parva]|nr:DUF6678 family protein [Aquirhabdus parva]
MHLYSIQVRIILIDDTVTNWSSWLTLPSNSYAEIAKFGPFRLVDVLSIEINPNETKEMGRLLPNKNIDHSLAIIDKLELEGIAFRIDDGVLVIEFG